MREVKEPADRLQLFKLILRLVHQQGSKPVQAVETPFWHFGATTLSTNDIRHKSTLNYAGCRNYFNVMLNVIMLRVLCLRAGTF